MHQYEKIAEKEMEMWSHLFKNLLLMYLWGVILTNEMTTLVTQRFRSTSGEQFASFRWTGLRKQWETDTYTEHTVHRIIQILKKKERQTDIHRRQLKPVPRRFTPGHWTGRHLPPGVSWSLFKVLSVGQTSARSRVEEDGGGRNVLSDATRKRHLGSDRWGS